MPIREDVPLRGLTTLDVGGPARYLVDAHAEEEVARAVDFAAQRELPLFVLGGGSNVLVADSGYRGVVLRVLLKGVVERNPEDAGDDSAGIAAAARGGSVILEAAAGEPWDDFVTSCVERDLAGIECLSGIPGSSGATPIQNVGAYGQEVSGTIRCLRAFDRLTGRIVEIDSEQCAFGYRSSLFNTVARDRYIVLGVTFALCPGGAPALSHDDLRKTLPPGSAPTLVQVREAVRAARRRKGMLLEEGDPESRSAGSFFKNPVVTQGFYRGLVAAEGREVPAYGAGEGMMKLPAAWLIEQSGVQRGLTRGGAGVSTRHALALVNRGTATAQELLDLAREIRRLVLERFAITLELEPVLLGFDNDF